MNVKRTMPRYVILACVGILLVGAVFIFRMIFESPRKVRFSHSEKTIVEAAQAVPADKKEHPLVVGEVIVQDIEGRKISGLTSAVFSDNWIAFPVWLLLEGKNLFFQSTGVHTSRETHFFEWMSPLRQGEGHS